VLYRQGESLFCGVTYELERSFKWVKNFTDAQGDGKAALKIASTGLKKTTASTSMKDGNNYSKLHVLYEKDLTTVVYVVLDYITGAVDSV
jgi:hypothetical protein